MTNTAELPEILVVGSMGAQMRDDLEGKVSWRDFSAVEDKARFLEENASRIGGIVMGGTDSATPELLDALPALRIVSCYGVGYDGVDAARCASKGIMVTHTPGVLSDDVANLAIALLLSTTRRVVAYDRYLREGRWKAEGSPPLTRGIAGKQVGVVGMGRIGQEIARKLTVFDCAIAYHTRTARPDLPWRHYADLVEMASDSTALILITPGGPATHHLVNARVMEALGPEGTLINVARGSVVDQPAMVAALKDGRLGAAGLDVFDNEPDVPEELFGLDNVVLTPHVASATVETRAAMRKLVVDNLLQWLTQGSAITPVPECAHLDPGGRRTE